MMIHHGQDKLADPASFAANYVVPLHLPFPLLMAHLEGYTEVFGSWMLILGLFAPLDALALIGTMGVAAYRAALSRGQRRPAAVRSGSPVFRCGHRRRTRQLTASCQRVKGRDLVG